MSAHDSSLHPPFGRRLFLATAAGAAASLLAGRTASADAPAASPEIMGRGARSLSLLNTHTGESVSAVYWADGEYRAEGLAAIDRVLRDHRTGLVRPIDRRLLDVLSALRQDVGTRAPFHVISCYRSPQSNAALRRAGRAVAEHSLHMEGKAADIRVPGVPLEELHRAAVARRAGGVGYYSGPSFVHVDVGRVRYW
jgi:uncharacterized protein YcbK (DUF882 family)